MSYTITEVLTIDVDIFETLFNASYEKMEQGTMPWGSLNNPSTLEEKKEVLKERFATFCTWPTTKVILWSKDDTPIQIAAGNIDPYDSSYIGWSWALLGPDANNSKSWLYDVNYLAQTKEHLKELFGIIGQKIECVKDGTLYNYHMNKPSAPTFYEVTEEISADGKIAVLRYAYL